MNLRGAYQNGGILERLAINGQVYLISDADENDRVTGQTSFALTTPTFLLDVPSGTTAMPLFLSLTQAGTVAGGAISVYISIDNIDRYNTGGTDETNVLASRTGGNAAYTRACAFYSGATAVSAAGVRIFPATMGADIDTAEGAVQGPYWSAEVPIFLEGPAAFLVFTYATGTGPTWEWTFAYAEFASGDLPIFGA